MRPDCKACGGCFHYDGPSECVDNLVAQRDALRDEVAHWKGRAELAEKMADVVTELVSVAKDAERARIVAWLREQEAARAYGYARSPEAVRIIGRLADAIERGEE